MKRMVRVRQFATGLGLATSLLALAGGAAAGTPAGAWAAPAIIVNPSGWTAAEQANWYHLDQGSRLMPLTWFKALQQPGAPGKPFLDNAYLASFRILPDPNGSLPIGFSVDNSNDTKYVKTQLKWWAGQGHNEQWVGLNCAACHTSEITYHDRSLVIEGAPGLFDYQNFVAAVDLSLAQTSASAAPGANHTRWDQFAAKVLSAQDKNDNPKRLLAALNELIAWEGEASAINQTDLKYGFGRVDAVGHILNRILLFGGARQPMTTASDAPVSYPHLWNTNLEDHVEWDGIAQNSALGIGLGTFQYGALGRNTGEVLGVFGEAVIKPRTNAHDYSGFTSSVQVQNLYHLEAQVEQLRSPRWPSAQFGTPGDIGLTDATGHKLTPAQVVFAGQALFDSDCSSCHLPPPYTAQHPYRETLWTFKQMGANTQTGPNNPSNLTDIWMACNTWDDHGNSGGLTGIPADYISGDPLKAYEPVNALLVTTVKGVLIANGGNILKIAAETFFGITPPPNPHAPFLAVSGTAKERRLQKCLANAGDPLLAYKARPLEGIWATPPYLHNGSVPTLYDLLLPPALRPKTFYLGTRVYDPQKAGYETTAKAPGNSFLFDTTLDGNSNAGHVYGVEKLTEIERLELLEYLKSI